MSSESVNKYCQRFLVTCTLKLIVHCSPSVLFAVFRSFFVQLNTFTSAHPKRGIGVLSDEYTDCIFTHTPISHRRRYEDLNNSAFVDAGVTLVALVKANSMS